MAAENDLQMKLRKRVTPSLMTLLLAGGAGNLSAQDFRTPPEAPVTVSTSHEPGKEQTAHVGDVLAGVEARGHPWVLVGGRATADCRIIWRLTPERSAPSIPVRSNVTLTATPFWELAAKEFEISLTDKKKRAFEITPEGHFNGRYVSASGVMRTGAQIKPERCRFEPIFEPDEATVSVLNRELIYSGKSASALRFVHQQSTSHDSAPAPSRRELEYPPDSDIVQAGQFRLEILEATAEIIRYKVLEDGTENLLEGLP